MLTYEEYVKLRVINDEKLALLESLIGEKIPIDLLKKAIEEHSVEEFMRKYYCKELQQAITDISSCNSLQIEGVNVIEFSGESFAMLVSALGAYNHDEEMDFKFREGGSKTLATSLITDEFMGHFSNKERALILLGYTKVPEDSLYLCGPQDLCSVNDNGTYEKREGVMGVNYMPSRQMAKQTSCIYNEYAILRKNKNGEEMLPTCVVSFSYDIDEKTKSFAQKHNLPVFVIDWSKYKQIQKHKLEVFEKKENPTLEELENYLFGVVAYYEELICYNLEQDNAISWTNCIDEIIRKISEIEEKLEIDKNSRYWPVCKKFIEFQQSTRNDAIGRIFANSIFKGSCPKNAKGN